MRPKFNRQQKVFYRINNQIQARELRVLDETGKQIAVLPKDEALKMAQEQELDLVEVAPKAVPPVAKIIDYSKFLYQLKKKKQEEKKKTTTSETKQIRMGPFIGDHDLDIKLKKAKEFLNDGDKVKFLVRFKGREMARQDIGRGVLNKVIEKLGELSKVERDIHMEGRQMVMLVSRNSAKKVISSEGSPIPEPIGSAEIS